MRPRMRVDIRAKLGPAAERRLAVFEPAKNKIMVVLSNTKNGPTARMSVLLISNN